MQIGCIDSPPDAAVELLILVSGQSPHLCGTGATDWGGNASRVELPTAGQMTSR